MKNCQIGWIDIFFWSGWNPGAIPESRSARRAYEKKLAAHIITERYTSLVEQGIVIRVKFRGYDNGDDYAAGADITVYGRFTAASGEEFVQKAKWCIEDVPDGHAFVIFYGRVRLTENDFAGDGTISAKALKRLRAADARVHEQQRHGAGTDLQ